MADTPVSSSDAAADSQSVLSAEMDAISESYAASGSVETQPRLDYAPYRSSVLRHPTKDLHLSLIHI